MATTGFDYARQLLRGLRCAALSETLLVGGDRELGLILTKEFCGKALNDMEKCCRRSTRLASNGSKMGSDRGSRRPEAGFLLGADDKGGDGLARGLCEQPGLWGRAVDVVLVERDGDLGE